MYVKFHIVLFFNGFKIVVQAELVTETSSWELGSFLGKGEFGWGKSNVAFAVLPNVVILSE